ncbi:hypothetical protein IAG25_28200 [Caballeronia sp. EK]|jgi:hypothetical protein|uniref:hypothetical protein n=1 Tax=Caballeronia sp. EK TaxID=2767469 RepID=UPI00165657F6|nr:hypothetical protein [Caballeronia sp. EK]MBC8640705.1 hypothetical protein [Caballeronia sp. EK]
MNVAEAMLGLPHGFFDQPHPALTPETISRLKAPLDFVQTDDEAQAESEVRKLRSLSTSTNHHLLKSVH